MVDSESGLRFETQPKNTPGGILSILFRKIMSEGGFMNYVNILIDRYITRASANSVSAAKRRTKNTLKTNLTSPEMTFKVFVDLIFFYLQARKMSITIKLTYANGDESVHSIDVTPNIAEPVNDAKETDDDSSNKGDDNNSSS